MKFTINKPGFTSEQVEYRRGCVTRKCNDAIAKLDKEIKELQAKKAEYVEGLKSIEPEVKAPKKKKTTKKK